MIKTKQPIISINGFNIGDKVRLKDGDGREHIIKSFSIEGLNEFFFEVQFEDGSWTMLDNIELLPSVLNEAAHKFAVFYDQGTCDGIAQDCFKAGAEWMAEQGETLDSLIWKDEDDKLFIDAFVDENKFKMAENVTIQIRKKQ